MAPFDMVLYLVCQVVCQPKRVLKGWWCLAQTGLPPLTHSVSSAVGGEHCWAGAAHQITASPTPTMIPFPCLQHVLEHMHGFFLL
jgi:hypothetical protein